MLGWWIIVYEQTLEEREAVDQDTQVAFLARWDAGIGGTHWLNELVKSGKAVQHSFAGYPNRFTATAGDVLPLLGEPPSPTSLLVRGKYAMPAGWRGRVEIYSDRIARCPRDRTLTIDAWDQS